MSRHMLFGLKVKHPSGSRLHHFFNRWDALHFLPISHLSAFTLNRALKDLKAPYSLLYFTSPAYQRWRKWEVIKLINILVIDFNIFARVIMVCYICLFLYNFGLCIRSGVVGQQLVCTHAQNCSIAS